MGRRDETKLRKHEWLLDERDHAILLALLKHKVLTTEQIKILFFCSLRRCQHRIKELKDLGLIASFTPRSVARNSSGFQNTSSTGNFPLSPRDVRTTAPAGPNRSTPISISLVWEASGYPGGDDVTPYSGRLHGSTPSVPGRARPLPRGPLFGFRRGGLHARSWTRSPSLVRLDRANRAGMERQPTPGRG
jgi:hypothetical protein